MVSTTRLIQRIRERVRGQAGAETDTRAGVPTVGGGPRTCTAALETLLAEGFLHRTGTGKYVALPSGADRLERERGTTVGDALSTLRQTKYGGARVRRFPATIRRPRCGVRVATASSRSIRKPRNHLAVAQGRFGLAANTSAAARQLSTPTEIPRRKVPQFYLAAPTF